MALREHLAQLGDELDALRLAARQSGDGWPGMREYGASSSPGECCWGGMASTAFRADPAEDVCVALLTQLIPSSTYPIRRQLRKMANAAIVETG